MGRSASALALAEAISCRCREARSRIISQSRACVDLQRARRSGTSLRQWTSLERLWFQWRFLHLPWCWQHQLLVGPSARPPARCDDGLAAQRWSLVTQHYNERHAVVRQRHILVQVWRRTCSSNKRKSLREKKK